MTVGLVKLNKSRHFDHKEMKLKRLTTPASSIFPDINYPFSSFNLTVNIHIQPSTPLIQFTQAGVPFLDQCNNSSCVFCAPSTAPRHLRTREMRPKLQINKVILMLFLEKFRYAISNGTTIA